MSRLLRRLLIALAVLLVVAGAAVTGAGWAFSRYSGPGPLATTGPVLVPRGTPEVVGQALVDAGVIRDVWSFRIAAYLTREKGPLRSGEFLFPEHASLFATLTILRRGQSVQHKLTIPEGLTAYQIGQIFDRAPVMDGSTPPIADGTLLPETYAYVYGTAREAMVARAKSAMDKQLAAIWAARDPALTLTTPQQLVTLASIVERETARPEERAHIAAVFLNRLKRGMKLQSDPTTAYAASGGHSTNDRGLTRADLDSPNPYNTYYAAGLPPGPIASPGLAAMQAVAHPLASDDLYFVADGSGGHAFAKTLDEHQRNVARWRTLEGHTPAPSPCPAARCG
jgi:UPF0755 protein